ncbi:MAG TPA: MASE3 domain-containing protein, partial [Candidatus Sulfotelmatobacter sp.]|nr:MASE3 domain-containing protein [Candidatus Sulfotelmatobacter sp.]
MVAGLAGALTFAGLFLARLYNYLLFHRLAELFSVVIAFGIFMITWNCRQFLQNGCLRLLGIGWFSVAVLDLLHTLAYKGMAIFPAEGANLPTQLWIAARYLESLSLLLGPLLLRRQLKAGGILLAYGLVTLLLLFSIFVWKIFPTCYVEGVGLTPFKRGSEYAICLILAGALLCLLREGESFDPQVRGWLAWAIVITIASESAFTLYSDVYGNANLLGHSLKILAFYFLYRAIIETGLSQPYALLLRELKQHEAELAGAKQRLAQANEGLERKVEQRTAKLNETVGELEHFSYTITHDMRAPLRAMQGLGNMLLEECADCPHPNGKNFLRLIAQSAGRMDSLIVDALQYSKVVRQEFALKPINAGALLRGMVESYPQFQPPKAEVTLEGNIPQVLGNEAGLTQCFSNLLGNAVKFVTPGKVPKIRVWAEVLQPAVSSLQPPAPSVRLWFEDNGVGINKQYHRQIWVMFQRLSKDYEGTGIGLALVRKVVERMKGRV